MASFFDGWSGAAFGFDFCAIPSLMNNFQECDALNYVIDRLGEELPNYRVDPVLGALPQSSFKLPAPEGGTRGPLIIQGSDITIDLNGSTLSVDNGPILTYVGDMNNYQNIEIRNGVIKGGTLVLPAHSTVKDLRMYNCNGPCIQAGKYSIVQRITATDGIIVDCPSVVTDSVTEAPDGFAFLNNSLFPGSSGICASSNITSPPRLTIRIR